MSKTSNQKSKRPFVLIVIDGWGIAKHQPDNPIEMAKTPNYNILWEKHLHTTLSASGEDVGLLPGQDGNSEAGHMNLGAGRIVKQDIVVISESIADGTFFKNPAFIAATNHANRNGSALHLMGLLTDKNSGHANPDHLQALLKLARQRGVKRVFLHLFTDGRDTPKYSALGFLRSLEETLQPHERIVTVMGRVFLDRKKYWHKTERAFNALVLGEGKIVTKPEQAIKDAYAAGESDEFISPCIINLEGDKSFGRIKDGDAVIFFNLRSDRARQLTKPFVQVEFEKLNPGSFRRQKILKDLVFVAMTDFGPDLDKVLTAYPSIDIDGTLPSVLHNVKQLYIAESEKYAHITYFFNGGHPDAVGGEDRINIPSPIVESYDQVPEMSADKITEVVINNIREGNYDFYGINFANADMIGHTGNLGAAIKAVECIDRCIGRIMREVLARDGVLFITADHGNVEEIIDVKTGKIDTEHSSNPVPFFIVANKKLAKKQVLPAGRLADVATTILAVMGIESSREMTGRNLLNI